MSKVKYRVHIKLWEENGYEGIVDALTEEGMKVKYVTPRRYEDRGKAREQAIKGFKGAVAALVPGADIEIEEIETSLLEDFAGGIKEE